MNRKTNGLIRFYLLKFAAVILVFVATTVVSAQNYDLNWHTVDGGGGFSAGGGFELVGTIGQPDAGFMSSGSYELTGGFLAAVQVLTEVELPGSSVTPTAGDLGSGDIDALELSDNVDYSLRRSSTSVAAVTRFELSATSPILNPTSFEFTLEGSVFARTAVDQTIEFFDYDANVWESVDTRAASRFVDSIATFSSNGDLSRFVDDNGDVEARVMFQSLVPRQQFTSRTDQAFWTIVGY